jgi:hypothetical protein
MKLVTVKKGAKKNLSQFGTYPAEAAKGKEFEPS